MKIWEYGDFGNTCRFEIQNYNKGVIKMKLWDYFSYRLEKWEIGDNSRGLFPTKITIENIPENTTLIDYIGRILDCDR